MVDVADRWNQFFWRAYSTELGPFLQRAQQLRRQTVRTPGEDEEFELVCCGLSPVDSASVGI